MTGVDPKSILCEFFKAGQCGKGYKCKFSHDLNIQRKGEKIDIYSDKRDEGKWCNMSIATVISLYSHITTIEFLCYVNCVRHYGWMGPGDARESCGIKRKRVQPE